MAATYGTYRETDIANRFLQQIGAPQTPDMQRAVIAWMRLESGQGTITANNPWNLTGSLWANIVGYWRGGSATEQHDFPVFATVYDGVAAAAQNLSTPNYGYPAVVSAARRGDAAGFLQALAQSSWCSCRYPQWQSRGGAQQAIAGVIPGTVTSHAAGAAATPGAILVSTETEIKAALDAVVKAIPGASILDLKQGQVSIPESYIGCPKGFTALAYPSVGNPPNTHVCFLTDLALVPGIEKGGAALGDFAGVAAAILDPTHWARFLAIAGGAGLILWGGKIVWEASS